MNAPLVDHHLHATHLFFARRHHHRDGHVQALAQVVRQHGRLRARVHRRQGERVELRGRGDGLERTRRRRRRVRPRVLARAARFGSLARSSRVAAPAAVAASVVVVVVVVVQARARHRPRGGGGGVILFLVRAHLLLVLSPRLRAHVEDGRARVRAALQRRGLFLLPHHAHETSYDLPRGDGVLDHVELGHLPHHRGRGFS
mmetsp:Transcript_2667/g.8572  ORF Transcript_2667/g.8572 Transcript_2667/m.8572 type:complete len:201 (-) Transcript_2667:496-1098(-)